MQNAHSSRDLTRTTLGVLFIGGLIATTLWIVRPFLSSLLWATMIVIPTWPLLLRLQARLWGRRGLATAFITLTLLLILIVPLGMAVGVLSANMDRIISWTGSVGKLALPPPPGWIAEIPLAGQGLSSAWQHLASEGTGGLAARVLPSAGRLLEWFAGQIGGAGAMVLHFLMTVIIAAILYMNGETAARGVRRFAYRLAGPNGEKAAILAANSIRGVATGVVVTAAVQSLLAGIGLLAASVPGASLLTAAILLLCFAQLGPTLVMVPAVVWKFYTGDALWGSILLVFAIVAGGIDNFLRPILIRRGADLPLLLIFAGVMGGLISMGLVGIFVGPVILAVTYTLLEDWVENRPEQAT